MPNLTDNADEADKAKAYWANEAILMTNVATDAIYAVEIDDVTILLDETNFLNKTTDATDATEADEAEVDMVNEATDATDKADKANAFDKRNKTGKSEANGAENAIV